MPLHPQIEQGLRAMAALKLPPIETLSPAEAREQIIALAKMRGPSTAPIAGTAALAAPGPGGAIPLRLYRPVGSGSRPALLYFHGGGHVIGNLDTHDAVARNLCAGAGIAVVSVDYRMGPEHRFPAAVEDCWAALTWLAAEGARHGVDPTRLAVGGDSAGGNLAAVVALMARDAGGPRLGLQSLVYPVADYAMTGASYGRYAEGYGVLTAAAMRWFREHYLRRADDAADWRASPLKAELKGVAPAIVITAECDVLHDEGVAYAAALRRAGVAVEHHDHAGMIHGFFGMAPAVDAAVEAQAQVAAALRRALF